MLSLSLGVAVRQVDGGEKREAQGAAGQDAAKRTLSARALDWLSLARQEETIMLSQWSKPNATDTATARVACHKAAARA